MAQKLADTATYLRSFVDGQGGGAVNYTAYPTDFDNNFLAIENSVDAVIDEVKLLNGQNSPLITDLIQSTSPAVTTGVMGEHSYLATLITSDTQIQVDPGSALPSVGRVSKSGTDTFTGSGGAGTRWIALQTTGNVTQETAASQGILDLWSAVWNGSIFTSITRLATVLPDGDYFQALLTNLDLDQSTTNTILVDSNSNIDLPAQPRVRNVDSTFTAASDAVDDIEFTDADVFDNGAMHDPGGTSENFTIPTGADGIYLIVVQTTFDESTSAGTPNSGTRRLLQIDHAATVVAAHEQVPHATLDTVMNVSAVVSASATDVIKAQVRQNSGGTMAVVLSSMTIAKIA